MANDDLISRAAAIECMKSMADGCYTRNNYAGIRCRACMWDDAMDIVDELPAVDAVPVVHAQWIEEEGRPHHWHCSSCKAVVGVAGRFGNYCLYCGAKIGGDPDE